MQTDSAREQNRAAIVDYIASGTTRTGHGRIGLELEHIIVKRMTHAAVSYSEKGGIADILRALAEHYDSMTVKDGQLIGLVRKDSNITIEPAGQLEISVAPRSFIADIEKIYHDFRSYLDPILDALGLEALTLGYHPTARAADLELIPKERYRLMDDYFKHTGKHGAAMMRGSASVQASIDFVDEADAILKLRVASALGPLLAFVCDNAPVFEGELAHPRMARTQIWNDVDPDRSMVVSGLFDTPDYTFLDYADYMMSRPPILVEEAGKTISTGARTADEVYADRIMDIAHVEHLLSMFFPDVRLKHYIEIRLADSLPIDYSLSYAALIKGIFYSHDNLEAISHMLEDICDDDIPQAKQALIADGYLALVYGRRAWQWLDELVACAWRTLPADERDYLVPLQTLVEKRTTLFDESFSTDDEPSSAELAARWVDSTHMLDDDRFGRAHIWDIMQSSTAIYHDQVVSFGYVPKLIDPVTNASLACTAEMTHRILCKIIDAYVKDKDYRVLFDFDKRLEELILCDPGYRQPLPICRIDIFMDEEGQADAQGNKPFAFCEFNTDGASAMNEDRAVSRALVESPTCKEMSQEFEIVPQSLFDPWVRRLMRIAREYDETLTHPHVAIVDFKQSGTPFEFEEFKKRFEAHGVSCSIYDIRDLDYDGTTLRGPDHRVIDVVYRRAVTSEIMEHYNEVEAFLQATRDGHICLVGSFKTQIAHCKRIFQILCDEATNDLLDEDEKAFVKAHVPYTTLLTRDCAVLDSVFDEREHWIIKPDDGYASQGVFAGQDYDDVAWSEIVSARLDGRHIVQAYCKQYASINSRVNAQEEDSVLFEPYNNLIGLFIYDGHYAGAYTRQGKNAIIAGIHGGITAGTLLARQKRMG